MKLKSKQNRKKIFCLIPARSKSKRIKNKNIQKIKGLELFVHTIKFAKKFKNIEICFSTDSRKYKNIASQYIKVGSLRPKRLSSDHVKTYDVFRYELKKAEKELGKKFKYLLLLQPTVPYRKKTDLIRAINYIKKNNVDSVVSLNSVKGFHPYRMKKISKKNKVYNYSGRKNENIEPIQKLPKIYLRSGSIYLIKREAFFKYKNLLGKKVRPIIVENKYAINIDNYEDMVIAKNA